MCANLYSKGKGPYFKEAAATFSWTETKKEKIAARKGEEGEGEEVAHFPKPKKSVTSLAPAVAEAQVCAERESPKQTPAQLLETHAPKAPLE